MASNNVFSFYTIMAYGLSYIVYIVYIVYHTVYTSQASEYWHGGRAGS
jgi:hypothetical protein